MSFFNRLLDNENSPHSTRIYCRYCGSTAVIKYGQYKNTQRYLCKSCQRKIKADNSPFHMKTPAEIIYTALDMYYSGGLMKEIGNYLQQNYGYHPHKKVLYRWIYKYTGLAASHFNNYHPVTGYSWILDETIIVLDGHHDIWIYDVFDQKTRFLIHTSACQARSPEHIENTIKAACQRADMIPVEIIVRKNFEFRDKLESLSPPGIRYRVRQTAINDLNDNELNDRFHGTLLNGNKAIRSFKNARVLINYLSGWSIDYNFFKPNPFLSGKTPAEKAGINYEIKSWNDLVLSSYQTTSRPMSSLKPVD